jgi:aspartate carbamoyltransferase regulatory subunit
LILKLLEEAKVEHTARDVEFSYTETNLCTNKRCISQTERGLKFAVLSNGESKCCAYCDSVIKN